MDIFFFFFFYTEVNIMQVSVKSMGVSDKAGRVLVKQDEVHEKWNGYLKKEKRMESGDRIRFYFGSTGGWRSGRTGLGGGKTLHWRRQEEQ